MRKTACIIVIWIILFIGIAFIICGANIVFGGGETAGTKVHETSSGVEVTADVSPATGAILMAVGILFVAIMLCFILKSKYVVIVFGIALAIFGFVVPIAHIINEGIEGCSSLIIMIFGVSGLYLVWTNLLRFTGHTKKAEKMDKKVGDSMWKLLKKLQDRVE